MPFDKKKYMKRWRAAHQKELKAYRKAHRKEQQAYNAEYHAAHQKERKAAGKAWRAANPTYNKKYRAAHPGLDKTREAKPERKAYQKAYSTTRIARNHAKWANRRPWNAKTQHRCPGPCKRVLPLTRDWWVVDRARESGVGLCRDCASEQANQYLLVATPLHRRIKKAILTILDAPRFTAREKGMFALNLARSVGSVFAVVHFDYEVDCAVADALEAAGLFKRGVA